MPSMGDGAFIFLLALLLLGPKRLPELARQIGKLMAEFRRASNEFRMQMEEELRISDQAERQKKIAELEAAAPPAPILDIPEPEHPHLPAPMVEVAGEAVADNRMDVSEPVPEVTQEPLPIATSGDLSMLPPATGLPVSRTSSASPLTPVLESIPHAADPEASLHG